MILLQENNELSNNEAMTIRVLCVAILVQKAQEPWLVWQPENQKVAGSIPS